KTPILVMPEAAVKPYHAGMRKFLSGAFRFAIDVDAKILPIIYTYKKPRGLFKLIKRKPWLHIHILAPVETILGASKKESIRKTKDHVHALMSKAFHTYSDIK